jgi:hypothetical protein
MFMLAAMTKWWVYVAGLANGENIYFKFWMDSEIPQIITNVET